MRKIREVLRLKHECGRSERQIERAIGVGHGTVGTYIRRAAVAGLSWEEASKLSDAEVEARLFQQVGRNEPPARAPIDLGWVHMELRRAGVTLELLWSEYQQAVADGETGRRAYQYSQFCELYRAYKKSALLVARAEPLPALLGRLQTMWTRPPEAARIGRRATKDEGGAGSPCVGQGECLADGEERRYQVHGEAMCWSEEEGMTSQERHRGEA